MSWRASKCFEGSGPFVVWTVSVAGARRHLIADATQRSFGVRLLDERTEDLKPGGAVVALMRKYARTPGVGAILRDPASGDLWVPLFVGQGQSPAPAYWVQLARSLPPELRFIDANGDVLVRKSSQGTYTKRRPLGGPLPAYPPDGSLEDLTAALLAAVATATPSDAGEQGAATSGPEAGPNLAEYQRTARDRLARRLKTVRKAAAKLQDQRAPDVAKLERQAELVAANLHAIRPEAFELKLEGEDAVPLDPELSPGQNLQEAYIRIKKARRSLAALAEQKAKSEADLVALSRDVEALRRTPLGLAEVTRILARHKLAAAHAAAVAAPAAEAQPWRLYDWRPDGAEPGAPPAALLLVGKSASDSDRLVKQAKANDFWVHAVGTTGSHVVVPARYVRGDALLPGLLRAAAILALHHSRLREDQRGEVYVSRRQHLRKRKGMAPGLWQIIKAETVYCVYTDDDLQRVLSLARPGR